MALISACRLARERSKLDMGGVLSGAQERVAPVLTTAIATALGLLPFLFSLTRLATRSWRHGNRHHRRAGYSLAVNLFILPALYLQVALGPAPAAAPSSWPSARGGLSVMIDSTAINQRNIISGVIVAVLLASVR
jgi:hypothetical protein